MPNPENRNDAAERYEYIRDHARKSALDSEHVKTAIHKISGLQGRIASLTAEHPTASPARQSAIESEVAAHRANQKSIAQAASHHIPSLPD